MAPLKLEITRIYMYMYMYTVVVERQTLAFPTHIVELEIPLRFYSHSQSKCPGRTCTGCVDVCRGWERSPRSVLVYSSVRFQR